MVWSEGYSDLEEIIVQISINLYYFFSNFKN